MILFIMALILFLHNKIIKYGPTVITSIATATDKAGNSIEASEVITVAEDKDTETINFNAGLE